MLKTPLRTGRFLLETGQMLKEMTLIAFLVLLTISCSPYNGISATSTNSSAELEKSPISNQVKKLLESRVTVDVSKNLGPMPGLFRAGAFRLFEEGMPAPTKDYIRQKYYADLLPGMITITVPMQADSLSEFKKKVEHDGLLLDAVEEAATVINRGGQVLFDVQWMPIWLSSIPRPGQGEFWRFPPKNYQKWQELISYIADYFRSKGLRGVNYRIWEEVDSSFTEGLKFWNGSEKDFLKLYEYSVRGIKSVDPDAKITFGNAHAYSDILRGVIHFAAKKKLSLDYAIYHPFRTLPETQAYSFDVNHIRELSLENGLSEKILIHAGSWNSWLEIGKKVLPNGQPDERSIERDSEYNSSYAIRTLYAQDSAGISYHSYFSRVDATFQRYYEAGLVGKNQQFYGDFGMLTRDLVIKPVFNSFKMLSILYGKPEGTTSNRLNVKVADDTNSVTALASQTRDKGKVRVLLTNYIPQPDKPDIYYKKIEKVLNDKYLASFYGKKFNRMEECLKNAAAKGSAGQKCVALAPPDMVPGLTCLSEKKGEQCLQYLPEHFLQFMEQAGEYLNHRPQIRKEVTIDLHNLPISGKARLSLYVIDHNNANSCTHNKKTEKKATNSFCGINGAIDNMVSNAKSEAENKSFLIAREYPSLKPQRSAIAADLFYSGTYIAPDDRIFRIRNYIDRINDDPGVSLEGSRKTKEILIQNGAMSETVEILPYGSVLMEISKVH